MGWSSFLGRLMQATGLTARQVASMEKRRVFRVRRHISLQGVRANGEPITLVAVNFGAWGMQVESPLRLRRDEAITLHRARQPEERDAPRGGAPLGRVVWVRRRKSGGIHDVGLVFVTDTDAQRRDAAAFLVNDCRVGVADPREHRRAPRVPTEMRGSIMTPDCRTSEVVVQDIAVGGALAVSPRSVERNVDIDMKVVVSEGTAPLSFHGTVVRSIRRGRGYELGVAFTAVSAAHRDALVAYLSRRLSDAT